MKKIQIAIDGPAGAGKSTVARRVAKELGYLYIDTGAMYRALTYLALKKKINLNDGAALKRLLDQTSIQLVQTDDGQEVYVDHENVTSEIRSREVSNAVSEVATHKEVRMEMVNRQRMLAQDGGVVMDGRDIGTNVLKDATLKIYLSASVEERARRRCQELQQKGTNTDLAQVKKEIELRDRLDSERDTAPLKKARDAIEIDTTHVTVDEVTKQILSLVKERD